MCEGDRLGMIAAGLVMESLADRLAIPHDNGADRRIGRGVSDSACR